MEYYKNIGANMHSKWVSTVTCPCDTYYHGAMIFCEKGKAKGIE